MRRQVHFSTPIAKGNDGKKKNHREPKRTMTPENSGAERMRSTFTSAQNAQRQNQTHRPRFTAPDSIRGLLESKKMAFPLSVSSNSWGCGAAGMAPTSQNGSIVFYSLHFLKEIPRHLQRSWMRFVNPTSEN